MFTAGVALCGQRSCGGVALGGRSLSLYWEGHGALTTPDSPEHLESAVERRRHQRGAHSHAQAGPPCFYPRFSMID